MSKESEIIRHLNYKIARAKKELDSFVEGIAKDPTNAFEWGDDALRAAARFRIFGWASRTLETKTVEEMLTGLRVDVCRDASSPRRSTSVLSNEMHRELLAAKADLLEILEGAVATEGANE